MKKSWFLWAAGAILLTIGVLISRSNIGDFWGGFCAGVGIGLLLGALRMQIRAKGNKS